MKYLVALFIFSSILLISCQVAPPPEPPPVIVSIGDSITMGIQDAGLRIDYQVRSYPYLIAKQMGISNSFRQPYARFPGIGVYPYERPLSIVGNEIIAEVWPDGILDIDTVIGRLLSPLCPTPYNNLGVNGARLFEMRSTTTMENSLPAGNYFFDIVLRNIDDPRIPDFGDTTVVEQAAMLQPDIILLWIGNNDILHTVLNGCGVNEDGFDIDPPTSPEAFESEFTNLLNDLKAITNGIVMASIPSYLPYGYALDGIFVSGRLSVFDPETFKPILFSCGEPYGDLYVPLYLEEIDAKHLTLNGAIVYLEEGKGFPDQTDLMEMGMGYEEGEAAAMIEAMTTFMELAGIPVLETSTPLEGNLTITQAEEERAKDIVDGYNTILSSLSESLDVPLVDITQSWWREYDLAPPELPAFGGYSGAFVLQDRDNTIFSLDGVHLNNLGHALAANSFIEALNQNYDLGIQPLNPDDYKGQYSGTELESTSIKALKSVYDAYVPQNP
jgi:lysophospholipase L1-like esterase